MQWRTWIFAALMATAAQAHESLPLGDGKVSSAPQVGYVYSCQQQFGHMQPDFPTPWVHGDSWAPDEKPTVQGSVDWPSSSITITREGDLRIVRANDLPKHPTGEFPISRSDPASRYDGNPNSIREQSILLQLPADPQIAATPSCVGMGMIGFMTSGAALFNALDAEGRDAPAHEVQDKCNGHPQQAGEYHYHNYSPCMEDRTGHTGEHGALLGYALDGFGIYGPYGEHGEALHSSDLDACHGHTHKILWDGQWVTMYHYHFTKDYPYTIGCFRGTPVQSPDQHMGGMQGRRRAGGGNDPLAEAARILNVPVEELRDAVGPPPPDIDHASQVLGIDRDTLRNALRQARQRTGP